MKRCLLTGASGFIGSGVLEYMLDKTDWTFVCICSWRHKGTPLNLQFSKDNSRVEIITHDLTGKMPELGTFDYILNLASESHVDRSLSDPVGFIENNISSTLQLLEYARTHWAADQVYKHVFLQFSTDEVYGANAHKEWDVLLPANPYSASKAAQEMICLAYWRSFGTPVVITNSNNIVGKNQDPEKFVPKLVKLIGEGKEVEVHATSTGKLGKRYYNPVQNVADALLFILEQFPQSYVAEADPRKQVNRPDRYNLPGGTELDNLEMAQLIAKLLDKPLQYRIISAESVRRGYDEFYPQTEGRLTELGWKPPMTLEEGLSWLK